MEWIKEDIINVKTWTSYYSYSTSSKQLDSDSVKDNIKFQNNPYSLTGFTDGEGCFEIRIQNITEWKV